MSPVSPEWVSHVVVQLRTFGDLPEAENLEEAREVTVGIGDRIDRAALVGELREGMLGKPHVFTETYSEFSWGADNAFLTITIEALSGMASIAYLTELTTRAVSKLQKHKARRRPDVQRLAEWVASVLRVPNNSVQVIEVAENGERVTLSVETPSGKFQAEDDGETRRLVPTTPKGKRNRR